jgi:lipoyl(octanoyl) transferase
MTQILVQQQEQSVFSRLGGMCGLNIRQLGLRDYHSTWQQMQQFTAQRDEYTADVLWLVEHHSVFTLGLNGKPEHLLKPGDIPVVQTDRGGQITYHGPGQLVVYTLIDLRRRQLGVRALISHMEQAIITLLATYQINAHTLSHAPGVYVDGAKIAALGLRVRRGCSYHGLALNVRMDLEPFSRVNPCGYAGLTTTQLNDLGVSADMAAVSERLLNYLSTRLNMQANPSQLSSPQHV